MPDKEKGMEPHPLNKICLEVKRVENNLVGELEVHGIKIPVPSWILEIGSREDFLCIIKNRQLLKEPHIISIPSFRWSSIANKISPIDDELHNEALNFLSNHHKVMYEPPEYFHYRMPQKLVQYALRGNVGKIREFYRIALIENDKESALNLLPSFEREFIRVEWDALMYKRYKLMKALKYKSLSKMKRIPEKSDVINIEDAWTKTKKTYLDHVLNGALEARKYKSTTYIPAIKTLTGSSNKIDRSYVIKQNKYTDFLWREVLDGPYCPSGRIWFHISISKTVLNEEGETGVSEILDIVNKSFIPSSHAGICLTMYGWEDAFLNETSRKNLQFLTRDLADTAAQQKLPFYAARSKWVGLYLIDDGLIFPGSMINENERVPSSGGMSSNDPKIFGKVAAYGFCKDLKINDLFERGSEIGQFYKPRRLHHFDGILDYCPVELQSDHKRFRMEFGKPRNIATHLQEIREIRESLKKGKRKPATEYIKKSYLWKGIR